MSMKCQKRNGQIVEFNESKIVTAIAKAAAAAEDTTVTTANAKKLADAVTTGFAGKDVATVEEIQDAVEDQLMQLYPATAKAFILYRSQHAAMRKLSEAANLSLVDDYLSQADWRVRENSNMAYSLQGLNNHISSEISKTYWLERLYPRKVKTAHAAGAIHIHDLGVLGPYCVGWDLYDLLKFGFKGVAGKTESAPAKHFRTALGQAVNFLFSLQGEAAGAQAFSSFDTFLAPFIRYDALDYSAVKQALQEFVFNMNVSTRTGFQSPFTNITLDLQAPKSLASRRVLIGGKEQDQYYGDFQLEMDMLNRAFLEVMTEGDALGRVFTFPIPTYNITKDFDWERPGLERLWEMTAKYGIPYFSNFVNSDMDPDESRSMCCRLRLDKRELLQRGGGLFGAAEKTGSLGVVTINMPRLGYLATSKQDFFDDLAELMDLSRDSLEIKRKILERFTEQGLYPYIRFYLQSVKESHGQYWKNHFSTIGLVGMNEACLNLLGVGIHTDEGKAFAVEVLDFMRRRLADYQESTGNLYNLEATPAEGTSYRLASLDRKAFGSGIVTAGVGGAPYYTNSTQLPVSYTSDIWEALDHQDALQTRYSGGTVVHTFVGEAVSDPASVKAFVKMVCENYRLPYFTLTPTFSICADCGYKSGEHSSCPTCGKPTEVYSRIVGYIRPVQQWNDGKKHEFKQRQSFILN